MKRVQPDINKQQVDTFIAKTGANRKLKRLWGTTTVNGTEVLHDKRHYHGSAKVPGEPDDTLASNETLFKFLKVWEDVKDYEGKGIKRAWFTLNKSNGPEYLNVEASFVAENLNRMWWDDNDGVRPENLTLTTSIVISENFDNVSTLSGFDWSASEEDKIQYIIDNYETLWTNKKITQEGIGIINKGSVLDPELKVEVPDEDDLSPDDPWMAILSRYALRSSGVPCTIKDIEVGLGDGRNTVYNTIVVTLEIPYFAFTTNSPIVQKILDDLDSKNFPKAPLRGRFSIYNGYTSNNEHVTQALAKQNNTYEAGAVDIDNTVLTRDYLQWEDSTIQASVYENFWLQDGKTWYFKADVIDNPKAYGITHADLNSYLFSLLDTGYKKKKVKWYKKLVAVVVFVIAVILTFVPGAQGFSAILYNVAYAIMVGALVISLSTMALSALGATEWAMAFAWVSKIIAPLVTVAAIYMAVYGFVEKGAEEALKQYIGNELDEFVFDAILGEFGDLGRLVADAMAGKIDPKTLDSINRVASVYTNLQLSKLKEISERNKDLKAEYDKLTEDTEMSNDVMMNYMRIYPKPATADWSMYAGKFDLPYEATSGPLSTGNVQKTTRQAIRKTTYNEAMFEGMLLS